MSQSSSSTRAAENYSLPEALPCIHQVREGSHSRPGFLPHGALDVLLRPIVLAVRTSAMRHPLDGRHAAHNLRWVRHCAAPLLLHLLPLLFWQVSHLSIRGNSLPRCGREREAPKGADDVARLLLDSLTFVPLCRAGEAVLAPERACARNLEVPGGRGDGSERGRWEEDVSGGRMENEREEGSADEGAKEIVPPCDVVGLRGCGISVM